MNEREYEKLIKMAHEVETAIDSQSRIVFPEDYMSKVLEKTNRLIGFILAFEKL